MIYIYVCHLTYLFFGSSVSIRRWTYVHYLCTRLKMLSGTRCHLAGTLPQEWGIWGQNRQFSVTLPIWTLLQFQRNKNILHDISHTHPPTYTYTTHRYLQFLFQQVRKVLWTRKTPASLLTLVYAYGKPHLPPVHKYSSLHSDMHRATAGHCLDAALHALYRQYRSEGLIASFKSIT